MCIRDRYAREQIDWDYVNFGLDLQPTIDLIESASPVGILACLDEECIMPKASDQTFTDKIASIWGSSRTGVPHDEAGAASAAERGVAHGSTKFVASRQAQRFMVRHYAAHVEYSTDLWLDKNRDPLNESTTRLLADAEQPFVAALFGDAAARAVEDAGARKRGGRRGAFRTVGQRHREQLASLMAQLDATQPHFVRCIVPNAEKRPGRLDAPMVLDQLRCNGVLEGIRIARLGYPNRLLFTEFRSRYELLVDDAAGARAAAGTGDARAACAQIAAAVGLAPEAFRIGQTKIFFKAGVLADLEERRDAYLNALFTRFNAACRRASAVRRMHKWLRRAAAADTLRSTGAAYAKLHELPWWRLYERLQPMLHASQHDEERRRRELEVAMARERSERDAREAQALAALRAEADEVRAALEEQRAVQADTAQALEAAQAAAAQREAQLGEAGDALRAAEAHIAELLAALDGLRDEAAGARERADGAEEHAARLAAEVTEHTEALAALRGEKAAVEQEQAVSAEQLAALQEALRLAEAKFQDHVQESEAITRDLALRHEAEMGEAHEAQQRAARTHAEEQRAAAQRAEHAEEALVRVQAAMDAVEQRAAQAEEVLAARTTELDAAKAALGEERAARTRAEETLAARTAELDEAAAALAASGHTASAAAAERDAAASRATTLQRELDAERAQRAQLENKVREQSEAVRAREAAADAALAEHSQLLKTHQATEAEMRRLQSMQSKTIVEHVHVLEEAKKYTDRQLSDVQSELQELATYARTLEKTKARLQQENESLARREPEPQQQQQSAAARNELTRQRDEACAQRDEARAQLRRAKQQSDLAVQRAKLEQEEKVRQLEEELARTRAGRAPADAQRVLHDMRGDRPMSSAARKVLEELRMENERLEKDLAAKANSIRAQRTPGSPARPTSIHNVVLNRVGNPR